MKRKFIKKTVSVLLSIVLILNLTVGISAHEIYYESSTSPIVLKWVNTHNGKYRMKINGDRLYNEDMVYIHYYDYTLYQTKYNTAKTSWNNCANLIISEGVTNPAAANVMVVTPSEGDWIRYRGYSSATVYGHTALIDTNGNEILDYDSAEASTGQIAYATVRINPDPSIFDTETRVLAVMVHELGHCLGLGHTDGSYLSTTAPSVMKSNNSTYVVPQAHDIADITAKYG